MLRFVSRRILRDGEVDDAAGSRGGLPKLWKRGRGDLRVRLWHCGQTKGRRAARLGFGGIMKEIYSS